ncbi:hypothetical protein B1207_14575 [Legionella quinlivanii]|uniref:Uncharacterized protein n=1 Tax=Legionella quinlivanii TaxID=45073 RepID=A0A364LGA3_9GAMM|nr:hypothetical protein [Legionella quinlivanii]RAP34914.1 hypothetical protein B1207_14575 [Legionella quinlivanii]
MSDNVVWIFKNVKKSLVEQQNEMLLSLGQGCEEDAFDQFIKNYDFGKLPREQPTVTLEDEIVKAFSKNSHYDEWLHYISQMKSDMDKNLKDKSTVVLTYKEWLIEFFKQRNLLREL